MNPVAPTPPISPPDNSDRIATTAWVLACAPSFGTGVASFNGRTGAVTLTLTDVTSVGGAPISSPVFTGSPKSVTPAPADNSTNVATTAFVAASFLTIANAAVTYLPLAGGTLTGPLTPAGGIKGVTDGSSAAAGFVGEVLHAEQSTLQNLPNNTFVNIVSLVLTAGDWDVYSSFQMNGTPGNNITQISAALSPGGGNTVGGFYYHSPGTSQIGALGASLGTMRVNTATSTTITLQLYASFGTGSAAGVAGITARRMR